MTHRAFLIAAAALALASCGKNESADAGASGPDAAAEASPLSDPAAQPIKGEPDSAWIELMGAWAETGRCDDDLGRWVIEAEAFHLYEMHCPVDKLELLRNGVKATAQCTVEGDNDGVADVFWFLRQGDGSLTIVQDANGAMTTGLFLCEGEETEI